MGKQSGTANWTRAETAHLLSILEDILPFKPVEWEEVKTCFDAKYSKNQHAISALQRKFTTTLHQTKEPTGDPNIPSPVDDAKRIRNKMDKKTDGTGGSPANLDGGLFDRNDEEEDDDEDDDIDKIVGSSTGMDDYDNESFSALTWNAVSQICALAALVKRPSSNQLCQLFI